MRLSIITINRNNAKGLRKTIESVVTQTFTDFEYIVIDGDSTDESVKVIKQYEDKITYWVSEPDNGIYNAMNKGIVKAHGEYLQFLNSGDFLFDENVLMKVFVVNESADILYGERVSDLFDNGNQQIIKYPATLRFSFFVNSTLSHQASFLKRECFNKFGLYDERYKYASDWFLFMDWIFRKNVTYKYLAFPIVFFDVSGISSDPKNIQEMKRERDYVLAKEFSGLYADMKNLILLQEQRKYYDWNAEKIGKIVLLPLRKIRSLLNRII